MLESLKEYQSLARDFKAFDASLRIERPDDVTRWLEEVVAWEGKLPLKTPTPYDIPESSKLGIFSIIYNCSPLTTALTLNNVKLQLAQEEGSTRPRPETGAQEVSPSTFVSLGLEIEHAQYVHNPFTSYVINVYYSRQSLKAELGSGTERNLLQEKQIVDRRNAIQKKLKRYLQLLPVYIPEYVKRFPAVIEQGAQLAEDVTVPLPSSFTPQIRVECCPPLVTSIEERLREAQAYEALNDVRRYL